MTPCRTKVQSSHQSHPGGAYRRETFAQLLQHRRGQRCRRRQRCRLLWGRPQRPFCLARTRWKTWQAAGVPSALDCDAGLPDTQSMADPRSQPARTRAGKH